MARVNKEKQLNKRLKLLRNESDPFYFFSFDAIQFQGCQSFLFIYYPQERQNIKTNAFITIPYFALPSSLSSLPHQLILHIKSPETTQLSNTLSPNMHIQNNYCTPWSYLAIHFLNNFPSKSICIFSVFHSHSEITLQSLLFPSTNLYLICQTLLLRDHSQNLQNLYSSILKNDFILQKMQKFIIYLCYIGRVIQEESAPMTTNQRSNC